MQGPQYSIQPYGMGYGFFLLNDCVWRGLGQRPADDWYNEFRTHLLFSICICKVQLQF